MRPCAVRLFLCTAVNAMMIADTVSKMATSTPMTMPHVLKLIPIKPAVDCWRP